MVIRWMLVRSSKCDSWAAHIETVELLTQSQESADSVPVLFSLLSVSVSVLCR